MLGVALALGIPAIRADAQTADADAIDPDRSALDLNAALFARVLAIAIAVGGVTSLAFAAVLRSSGAALIRVALYVGIALQALATAAMFAVSVIAGILMLFLLALSIWYV
jgi:hypothetical protein